jgi:GTP cyclohydrolase I
MTTFPRGDADEMIVVSGLSFASQCEHHLVPFSGVAHIGILPGDTLLGLSKYARLVDWVAARPQIQERMTHSIVERLMATIQPEGAMVVLTAAHQCMICRGVRKSTAAMTTSAIRGAFDKEEFFELLRLQRI